MSTEKINSAELPVSEKPPVEQVELLKSEEVPGESEYKVGNKFYEKKQFKEAFEYFEKSAQANYPEAYLRLWGLYGGSLGIPKNIKKQAFYQEQITAHIEWFHKEANKDGAAANAQLNLGFCYENGLGVTKDLSKAAELLKRRQIKAIHLHNII